MGKIAHIGPFLVSGFFQQIPPEPIGLCVLNFRDSGELFTGFELLLRALKRSIGCGGELAFRRHRRVSFEDVS